MKDVVAINTLGFKCPVDGTLVHRPAKSVVTISDEDYDFFISEKAVADVSPEATIIANSLGLNFLKAHAPAAKVESEPKGKGTKGKGAKTEVPAPAETDEPDEL